MQQQQRQALNMINIFTACPDADYDNSNEQPALLIVRDLIKSKATGFTDKELNSIDVLMKSILQVISTGASKTICVI